MLLKPLLTLLLLAATTTTIELCQSEAKFNRVYYDDLNKLVIRKIMTTDNEICDTSSGKFYKILIQGSKTTSAVVIKKQIAPKHTYEFENEIKIMQHYKKYPSDHLIKYIDCYKSADYSYGIIMEKMGGSLEALSQIDHPTLNSLYSAFKLFPRRKQLWVYQQIALGLHNSGYTHHNIRPLNVLTDGPDFNHIKIVSFGLSKESETPCFFGTDFYKDLYKLHNSSSQRTNSGLMTPDKYDEHWKADIWALGVLIYELEISDKGNPFEFIDSSILPLDFITALVAKVLKGNWIAPNEFKHSPESSLECLHILLEEMMKVDRKDRVISAHDIANMLTPLIAAEEEEGKKKESERKGLLEAQTQAQRSDPTQMFLDHFLELLLGGLIIL